MLSQEKPWERKAAMREWDMGKNEKEKEKDKLRRDERPTEKRRHRTPSPEPGIKKIEMINRDKCVFRKFFHVCDYT